MTSFKLLATPTWTGTIANTPIKFPLDKQLGQGTFGTVYKTIHLGQPVAIKISRLDQPQQDEIRAVMTHEHHLLKELDHPNIIKLIGLAENNTQIALLLELSGMTLENLVEQELHANGPLIIRGLCDAIAYLQSQKIAHLDLNPKNCLLTGEHIRLSDFGTSRALDHHSKAPLWVGNSAFKGIEMLLGDTLTLNYDLFSFGLTIYYIASGGHTLVLDNKDETARLLALTLGPPDKDWLESVTTTYEKAMAENNLNPRATIQLKAWRDVLIPALTAAPKADSDTNIVLSTLTTEFPESLHRLFPNKSDTPLLKRALNTISYPNTRPATTDILENHV